ncbi:MAG: rhomboid family intramembrane serine protease, partial [Pseudomonadota bacterium]
LEGNITALGYFLQGWLPFVTHTLLHADFMHVGFNCIWLLAFGTPVAKRIGAARFLALAVVAAAAGAGLHLAFRWGSEIPMVGASGAVSGLFGAAVRFILAVPIGQYAMGSRIHLPRLPLFDRRVVVVTAVYLVINYALAVFMGTGGIGPESAGVAWDAHMGGYLAGLMLFPLFDPRRGEHASSSGGGGPGLNGSSGPNGGGSERPYLRRVK